MRILIVDSAIEETGVLQDLAEYRRHEVSVAILGDRNWTAKAREELNQLGIRVINWADAAILEPISEFTLVALPTFSPKTVSLDEISRFTRSQQLGLVALGCPAASTSHIVNIVEWCKRESIPFLSPSNTHATLVAEYTLLQIGTFSRRLQSAIKLPGSDLQYHDIAVAGTRTIIGKTLGVIGAAGRDGMATMKLAKQFGMRVLGLGSGSLKGDAQIIAAGATIARTREELIEASDFISINCTFRQENFGILGMKELSLLKENAIVVNPAGAELIDLKSLVHFLGSKQNSNRKQLFVFDKPYDKDSHQLPLLNELNLDSGEPNVVFTPRIAGYTFESKQKGIRNLIEQAIECEKKFVTSKSKPALTPEPLLCNAGEPNIAAITNSMKKAVQIAANAVKESRTLGLQWEYKNDASPVSQADRLSELIMKEHLKNDGFEFSLVGEETEEKCESPLGLSIIVDGIDGTRNFRDGNFGWAVSIAAIWKGECIAAVVYDGERKRMYFANRLEGAFLEDESGTVPIRVPERIPSDFSFSLGSARGAISREVMQGLSQQIKSLGGRNREWGVISLSICAIAHGGFGLAIEVNCSEHDFKAASFISEIAGASVELWTTHDPTRFHVCVAHPSLFNKVMDQFRLVIERQ